MSLDSYSFYINLNNWTKAKVIKMDAVVSIVSETGLISERAELFRSKLITDFHLLDNIDEKGTVETPKYYSKDVTEPEGLKRMMTEGNNALVKFQVYSCLNKAQVTWKERRMSRVKNKNSNWLPVDMWANWVLESGWFQNIMLTVILGNSMLLGIQAELHEMHDESLKGFNTVLDIFDYFSLFVFVLEIVLKWIDNFKLFWLNGWNIFDFLVTFLSVVPEIMRFTDTDGSSSAGQIDITVVNNLRGFRVLRSLKMVTRFRQVRLIALSVAKAFKAMLFIILLLATFMYILAIAGMIFFDSYAYSKKPGLMFNYNFRTLPSTFACLFQLLTLDRWYDILLEMMQVVDPFGAIFYIIFWILMGSFVFRNIFVGIMVNNFQSIRADLFQEVMEIQESKRQTVKMEKLNEELMKQDQLLNRGKGADGEDDAEEEKEIRKSWSKDDATNLLTANRMLPRNSRRRSTTTSSARQAVLKRTMDPSLEQVDMSQYQKDVSQLLIKTTDSSTDWQKTVSENLETISKNPIDTAWPKDTLFNYLLLMEALQENLAERTNLMDVVGQGLLHVFDN